MCIFCELYCAAGNEWRKENVSYFNISFDLIRHQKHRGQNIRMKHKRIIIKQLYSQNSLEENCYEKVFRRSPTEYTPLIYCTFEDMNQQSSN